MAQNTTHTHEIAFYQSAFSKEAAETARIPDGAILGGWLTENVKGFSVDNKEISYSVPLNSVVVSDVRAVYVPAKKVVSSVFKPIFKILGLTQKKPKVRMPQKTKSVGRGDDIDISTAQANTAKYGDPVRELFGKLKISPDFLTPPHRYFANKRDHWTEMLLCVGVGEYDVPISEIRIGDTPISSFGSLASAQVFSPGETVSGNNASQWWHAVPEVGGTRSGSSGLPLRPSYTATASAPVSSKTFSGTTITSHGAPFPANWNAGLKLNIEYSRSYHLSGNRITGSLSGISLTVGDMVYIGRGLGGPFVVDSVDNETSETAGTPSVLTGQAAASLDYSATAASFTVSAGTASGVFTLSEDYGDLSEVVASLNSQLDNGALRGLVTVNQSGGKIVITERPIYESRRIAVQSITAATSVFGDIAITNANAVVGQAAQLAVPSSFTLEGFSQPPQDAVISIRKVGEYFELVGNAGATITVQRRKADGTLDWNGFTESFTLSDSDISLDPTEVEAGWQGWFDVQPAGQISESIEVDIMFPQGLYATNDAGNVQARGANVTFQYRNKDTGVITSVGKGYSDANLNQISFTEKFNIGSGRWQFRVKRNEAEYNGTSGANKCEVYGLRSKIVGAPASYPDFTTLAIKIKGSEAASADADEMISVVATRKLNGAPTRTISEAVKYIARTQSLDTAKLSNLETIWSGRGDTFDYSFEKAHTIKQAANTALGAGFAEMITKDGVLTPVRDAKRNPLIRAHSFSAQNTTAPIVRNIELLSGDEVYGIDVEYVSSETYRVETVKCRAAGLTGTKIEKLKADGITDRNKAYQYGMRELMRKRYQRTTISTSTELDGFNANYNDMAFFVEDVPTYGQSALVVSATGFIIKISEPIQWVDGGDMVAALRLKNGELGDIFAISKVDKYTMQFAGELTVEPMQEIFIGTRATIGHSGIITDVKAQGATSAKVSAVGYTDRIYDYDNAQADN